MAEQKRLNPSAKKYEPLYIVERIYKADVGQRVSYENAANKGCGLPEVMTAIKQVGRQVGGDFSEVFKSVTADNGSEFLDSEGIKEAAKREEACCAYPYSGWERGSNGDSDRMPRCFAPKGMDLNGLTESNVQRIEYRANNCPRKILGYKIAPLGL